MILREFPPMGVYETLFKFADATQKYMGDPGTHPWAQGFPLTSQLKGGPALPGSVELEHTDLKYPKATGEIELREAISDYYNRFYDAGITPDHVAVFAGGRPAILATLAFLRPGTSILVEETEYTPYYDMLKILGNEVFLIPSHAGNRFRPGWADYENAAGQAQSGAMLLKSNPCNPTGVTTSGEDLANMARFFSQPGRAALFDEAYEFFRDPQPESVLRHIDDIDSTNIFVIGCATKGLQVPGLRVGWAISAQRHIEIFRNYSSFGMGGVSRASQLYVTKLLEPSRVEQARNAVAAHYNSQRNKYEQGLRGLGFELFTGSGGFYHWGRLPSQMTADEFNERLFEHEAGILPGRLCDMDRKDGAPSQLDNFVRFSFGAISADAYDGDMKILSACV